MFSVLVRMAWSFLVVAGVAACEIAEEMQASGGPEKHGFSLSPPPFDEAAYRAAMKLGQNALEARQAREAMSAFKQASRLKPNDADALLGLGEAAIAALDLAIAERSLERLGRLAGKVSEGRASQAKGILLFHQKRFEEAENVLARAVANDPSLWRAWSVLGRTRMRRGDHDGARSAFKTAMQHAPDTASSSNDVGMMYLVSRDPKSAVQRFERAISLDPGFKLARANLRLARAMLKDYDTALSGAPPDQVADVLNNTGYLAIQNGDYELADRLLRESMENSPVYKAVAAANLDLLARVQANHRTADQAEQSTKEFAPDAVQSTANALTDPQPAQAKRVPEPAIRALHMPGRQKLPLPPSATLASASQP